jgi:predicted RNA binding protein YcfA (HicA-like mRNA interferase family)
MSKLPILSGKELCKLLQLIGYIFDHQTGSHIILRNDSYPFRRLTVPNHKEISKGTLRNIIREAGLTLDEFMDLI